MTKEDVGEHVRRAKRDCRPCTLRAQCLRSPDTTADRHVAFFHGRGEPDTQRSRDTRTKRMTARIDSAHDREPSARRCAMVNPVWANLRHNTRMDRRTLRRRTYADGQWRRFGLVHEIEKLAKAKVHM